MRYGFENEAGCEEVSGLDVEVDEGIGDVEARGGIGCDDVSVERFGCLEVL